METKKTPKKSVKPSEHYKKNKKKSPAKWFIVSFFVLHTQENNFSNAVSENKIQSRSGFLLP